MLPIYLTIRYSILFYIFSIFNVKFSLKMHQNHIYQSNNFEMDFQTLFCILSRFCKNLLNYLVVSVKPENISSTYTGVFSPCVMFTFLHLQKVSPHLEFAHTQFCLIRYIMRLFIPPSFKFSR